MRATPPLLLGAATLLLLAGCGSSNVDTASMERQLAQRVERAAGLQAGDVTVECPHEEEAKVGNRFTCTVRYRGEKRSFVITLEEGDRYTARPSTTKR